MAKKAPKEYKPGQHVIVKLSNGRVEKARINHVIQHSDGMKLQVELEPICAQLISTNESFDRYHEGADFCVCKLFVFSKL